MFDQNEIQNLRSKIVKFFEQNSKVDEYDCADALQGGHSRFEVIRECREMLKEDLLKRDENFGVWIEVCQK